MDRKPDGVIWWVGDGANGKSTLMDALYRIFPGQFSSITVKRLVDGRDTPSLNGTLANIVKESSEGRVEDTEIYKAIGTHENFRVHRFHSQDDLEVRGNIHHIFSANSVPSFNDKGYSARRRTFIVPFKQRFTSDPSFEEKTFTPEIFGQLVTEMARYASKLANQGYKYKWSATTLAAKADYDMEANNAEEYVKELVSEGVVAFTSYNPVRIDYENWCADNGYVALGIGNLRKVLTACGFSRTSTWNTETSKPSNIYKLDSLSADTPLTTLNIGRPGLFTTQGFGHPVVPQQFDSPKADKDKPKPPKSRIREW
jgi:phage/plasmid-associated DNA primase